MRWILAGRTTFVVDAHLGDQDQRGQSRERKRFSFRQDR
jgi:hypothetical protein